ncbi:amidohydrolase family protein, partial [Chloroflexota bacterium]
MTKVVDVHNHLYPMEWIKLLETRAESPWVKWTGPTSMIFYVGGAPTSNVSRAGHYDPQARLDDMDRYGIDIQIVSLTIPSVELLPVKEGIEWAKRVNDYLAEVCQKYKGRFYAYATLPYQDIEEAVKELERCYKQLGAKGIILFSNINGKPIAVPVLYPVYEKAAEYDLPVFIHPAPSLTGEIMKQVKLPPALFGFTLDSTMAVISLIFQGVLEKYPRLKIIHSHLGGVVPYLVQRIDDSFRSYSDQIGFELPKRPTEYYQKQVYPDSISFHLPAMKCCLEFVGADHICLGTDYAHPVGNPEKAADYVRDLGLSEEDT